MQNTDFTISLSFNKAVDGFSLNKYAKENEGIMSEIKDDGGVTPVIQYPICGESYYMSVDWFDVISVTLCTKIVCCLMKMGCRVFTDTVGYHIATTMSESELTDNVYGLFTHIISSPEFFTELPRWSKLMESQMRHAWGVD